MLFIPQLHIQIVAITCTIILVILLTVKIYRSRALGRFHDTGQSSIRFSAIDLSVGLYLLWGLCILLFLSGSSVETGLTNSSSVLLWKWQTLILVYVLIRSAGKKGLIFGIVVVAGILQSMWAIGQQIGYIESNHSLFPITGLMSNPGQLGGFQAVAFVSTLLLLTERFNFRVLDFSLSGALLLIAYSLYIADSRAALVAVIAGIAVLYQKPLSRIFRKRKWIYLPAILLVAGLILALYGYRRGSADARLLIWRVSGDMIAQKPLLGHGIGGFNGQYMLCQARYFEQHPDSDFTMVTDNAAYPYNEFLHILIEQGAVGLLLFLVLIAVTTITATKKKRLAPLISLLVFSCFSYPADVFWLLILFPLLFACIESKPLYTVQIRLWGLVPISALLLMGVLSFREIQFYREADKNTQILSSNYDKQAVGYLSKHFGKLSCIRTFNTQFILWMSRYPEIVDERKFRYILPNCENWCDIGDYYVAKKNYDNAEAYYLTASQMIPSRLKPNYQLWRLYVEKGDSLAARKMADRMLSQPLKVENTFTLRAKVIIKKYYQQP